MALGTLSLSTTAGVQGRPFQAKIVGLTTGNVKVLHTSSPGFSTVNGNVMSDGLPYPVSTVVLREYDPGNGAGFLDSRIDVTAATRAGIAAQATASIASGRTLRGYRTAGDRQGDGSYFYSVRVEDDLGATISVPAGVPGFYRNGSANTALKAMLARVKAGTGRGKIVQKGDSTTMGIGAGPTGPTYLDGAASRRVASRLASLLTAAGYPALDNGIYSDNGAVVTLPAATSLPTYDPRVTSMGGWTASLSQSLAGGGALLGVSGGRLTAQFDNVNTFLVTMYRNAAGNMGIDVDGGPPTTGPASQAVTVGSGFVQAIVTAPNVGTHTIGLTPSANGMLLRSIVAYDSTKPAIDFLVHAASSATSANQAFVGSGWSNNDSLGLDAPDLTIIPLGLNDMRDQVNTATYASNLQAIVTKEKLSGDGLLVFPHPAGQINGTGPNYNLNVASYRAAAAAVAQTNSVAFFDMWEYFGGVVPATVDGVHPTTATYATIAQAQFLALMALAQ